MDTFKKICGKRKYLPHQTYSLYVGTYLVKVDTMSNFIIRECKAQKSSRYKELGNTLNVSYSKYSAML
jgi:hypothetical protein